MDNRPHIPAPRTNATAPSVGKFTSDVIVVGAGLSGLAAATRLRAAGFRVHVLEARDRAGGRAHNITTPNGLIVDAGAEFVGPTQDRIAHYANTHGVKTHKTYNKGNNLYYFRHNKRRYPAALGIPIEWGVVETLTALATIGRITNNITVGRPWEHPDADQLDAMTWGDWCQSHSWTRTAKLQLEMVATTTLSVRPDELSALFMMNYIAAAGNRRHKGKLTRLIGVSGGAQERFVDGGAALIPQRMAAALGSETITYNAPASKIAKNPAGYSVTTPQGVFQARRVVVAMSPAILHTIDFEPALPAPKQALHNAFTLGRIGKFFAVYDRPWWREHRWSGQTSGDGAPIDVTFESFTDNAHIMMGFISADKMTALDDAPESVVREQCLDTLESFYGHQVRTELRDWGIYRWNNQPYSWGGPTAVLGPGALTSYGEHLITPADGIYFASTETADYWTGYMDGAVRSGERAAQQIIEAATTDGKLPSLSNTLR